MIDGIGIAISTPVAVAILVFIFFIMVIKKANIQQIRTKWFSISMATENTMVTENSNEAPSIEKQPDTNYTIKE
ncbi:hypothetical protein [Gimesia algae]|uniref:Uncharacterized protein n=1 Tax=Gimesia algae TaxID=2527971 RepID=A0A517VGK2_9PLAN|nr:hypothetical protein [Gimesia algae]QDT92141.1 hypothetical protein Pan161_38070 [Gimesia algae]